SLAVVPGRPAGLYAATDDGIRYSPDEGQTWLARNAGLDIHDLRVVRLDPTRRNRLYAAGFGGIYRSEDRGRGWVAVSGGLTDRRGRGGGGGAGRRGGPYPRAAGRGGFWGHERGGRGAARHRRP